MENTFGINIIPNNDQQRLEALNRYQILDTPNEKAFDSVVKAIAEIFQVPVALISLVGAEQIFYKAAVGMGNMRSGGRGQGLCALGVLKQECTIIEDALEDRLLDNNPLVHGPFGLRSYAGAPLITHDGFLIGTVCLVDIKPRSFSAQDKIVLVSMAKVVMEQIELRLTNLQEIEKQQEINQQLSASERHFQHILDTMAEGVGIIDVSGDLTYANASAQQILGLTKSEVKTQTYIVPKWQRMRVDGSHMPPSEYPIAIMIATKVAVYDLEIAVQPPDRELFYLSVNAAPIFDEQNNLTGGVATFTDVTNRRKILQQKDEFISVASHELKTPVTSLKVSMQILNRMKDNIKPEILSRMITQSNKSLDNLTNLISDLLNSDRISKGMLHLRKSRFTIANMINECCSGTRNAGIYEITLEGDMGLEILADEYQLDQVMVNFVNNAVKYAPNSKQITVRIEQDLNEVKVSVIDHGPGIPNNNIPHLFERYYRADYSGIQISGLGLGLYISAEIIKKHGGRIGVDTELGKGSSFWFTLPLDLLPEYISI